MQKRILSLFLALALLCGLLPQMGLTAHAETHSGYCGAEGDGSNLSWSFDEDTGVLTITGSGEMADYDWDVGSYAPWLYYLHKITTVSLPNGLTSISDNAFLFCSELTSVTIPDGVTNIGDQAFSQCYALTSVTIPGSVTNIGDHAFSQCYALTSVTIPDSVTSIGFLAFDCCSQLRAIDVAFDNPNYSSKEGVLFNKSKTKLIQYPAGKPESAYRIPDSVTSIGEYAFSGCSALTSVTIPDSVTSIGWHAFEHCDALTSVTIPDSVTDMFWAPFSDCKRLTAIAVASGNPYYISKEGVLFNKSQTKLIQYPAGKVEKTYEIPTGVRSIDDAAFYGCSALTSVTIPNSVTSINMYAFRDCSALTSVTIPDGVRIINRGVFQECSALQNVSIPDSVREIRNYAFCDCSSLTSITIPASVKSIGESACGYDQRGEKLSDFTIYGYENTAAQRYAKENAFAFVSLGEAPPIVIAGTCGAEGDGSNLVWSLDEDTGLLTVSGSGAMADYGWTGEDYIDAPWYDYCEEITAVSLQEGVTSIGDLAFSGCYALTSVTIPDSVTSIGKGAFALTAYYDDPANWENGLLYIGKWLIAADESITTAQIRPGTSCIADGVFDNFENSLQSVTIPGSMKSIDRELFCRFTALTSVTIEDGVEKIGECAFLDCRASQVRICV